MGMRVRLCRLICRLRRCSSLYGVLVVSRSIAFFKRDGPRRTYGQAVAQAVAVIVADQLGFAVDYRDRALVARVCTQPAAVAFFFIDFYYFAYHTILLMQSTGYHIRIVS